jgi:hypothetical protein
MNSCYNIQAQNNSQVQEFTEGLGMESADATAEKDVGLGVGTAKQPKAFLGFPNLLGQ